MQKKFKAKHQRTQECTDITTHYRNNSIYTKSPPPPTEWRRKSADGCRATFSLLTQFQRKRKSLVFFQSINFLWSIVYLSETCEKETRVLVSDVPMFAPMTRGIAYSTSRTKRYAIIIRSTVFDIFSFIEGTAFKVSIRSDQYVISHM